MSAKTLMTFLMLTLAGLPAFADDGLSPEQKTKIEARFVTLGKLASDPDIVAGVKARNASEDAETKAMTQEKWKSATVLDKFVRSLGKTPVAEALKKAQASDPALSEAFASAADGTKVGYIAKPTNWSHKGKPKHDDPMAGKLWTGPVEVDASSGLKQIQIAVPILVDGKPAGSLVAGYQITKL